MKKFIQYIKKRKIESWLKEMNIIDYVIHDDLTVEVTGNIDLSYKNLKEIPIQFGIIYGHFVCNHNELKSLKGCPKEIHGSFDCSHNQLINLKDGIKKIKGDFNCSHNQLISLEGCPEEIEHSFFCNNNHINNLNYLPKKIKKTFDFSKNKLNSIEELLKNENINLELLIYFNNPLPEDLIDLIKENKEKRRQVIQIYYLEKTMNNEIKETENNLTLRKKIKI